MRGSEEVLLQCSLRENVVGEDCPAGCSHSNTVDAVSSRAIIIYFTIVFYCIILLYYCDSMIIFLSLVVQLLEFEVKPSIEIKIEIYIFILKIC